MEPSHSGPRVIYDIMICNSLLNRFNLLDEIKWICKEGASELVHFFRVLGSNHLGRGA